MNHTKPMISFGRDCRTRFQLDRFMISKNPYYSSSSYFFDWLMSGELTGVINIIERNYIINPDDIKSVEVAKGQFAPCDIKSGFIFIHDFGSNGVINNFHDCETAIKNSYSTSLEKYNYLGRKTDEFLTKNNDATIIYSGPESNTTILKLKNLLTQKYNNNFAFAHILEINKKNLNTIIDDNPLVYFVDEENSPKKGTPQEWEGNDESWQKVFEQINSSKD